MVKLHIYSNHLLYIKLKTLESLNKLCSSRFPRDKMVSENSVSQSRWHEIILWSWTNEEEQHRRSSLVILKQVYKKHFSTENKPSGVSGSLSSCYHWCERRKQSPADFKFKKSSMLAVGGRLILELLVFWWWWWYEGGGDLQHDGGSGGAAHLVDHDGGQDGAQQLEGKHSKSSWRYF